MKLKILLIASVFSLIGCSVSPGGDEEAVLIMKPLIFGHGGIDPTPVTTGLTLTAPTTDAVTFKIIPITYSQDVSDMMTSDNTPVNFSAHLTLKINKGETPDLLQHFGVDWYNQSVANTFFTTTREKACAYKMFELTSNRDIDQKVETEIFNELVRYFEKIKLPVTVLKVNVGKVTPSDAVLEETKRTAAQNQAVLTQGARAKAESARKQAEINKAEADKAYRIDMGMNNEEYMKMRSIEIEKEKIELVREKQNVTIIMGQGIVPVFNADKK